MDGRGFLGKAEEINPPKLTPKTQELRATGWMLSELMELSGDELAAWLDALADMHREMQAAIRT